MLCGVWQWPNSIMLTCGQDESRRWVETEPQYGGKPDGQADSLATRVGGSDLALRRLEIDEGRDIAKYGRQLKALGDDPSIAILEEVIADEREHYLTLGSLIRSRGALPALPPEQLQTALDDLVAARDKGHSQTAGWVGDAIYGINDGLGSIFGIVSGVSGATLGNSHFVLIAGMAGMVASALSMGSGAYLAAKSEREIYEAEFAREREAVEDNEPEAREVLSLSYQIRGLPEEDAERFVEHLAKDKSQLIKALARERLNTTEEGLSKPAVSAVSGALSTAVGAFIPIVPFFFLNGIPAVVVAAIVSLASSLRGRCSKVTRDHSVLVGKWIRNDLDWRIGGYCDIRHWDGAREAGQRLKTSCSNETG